MSTLRRQAVRVLVIDEQGRVLMIHGYDPHQPDESYWYTIGGGLEAGEDEPAAAIRETWEETGLRLEREQLIGPVFEDEVTFDFEGRTIVQRQRYFGVLTSHFEPATVGMRELEVRSTIALEWLDPSLQAKEDQPVYPEGLADLVQAVRVAARETTTSAPESQNWL